MTIDDLDLREIVRQFQRNEITEHHVYSNLAKVEKSPDNRKVLERIAADELAHYHAWKQHTEEDVPPDHLKILWYTLLARILGITFALKLMEQGEERAEAAYGAMVAKKHGLPEEICHIILAHAKEGDALYRSIEAEIIHRADFIYYGGLRSYLGLK